ncbi:VWA domain-containing protein [Rhodococcus sp. X156]|uniref:vWA domain-containing protein n=1 Tax=Rhodococcus sp. X156 TaxID=2499145 RepID=UPI000FDBFB60|nr:VWA domain-containing protein [Rhodococcus sp. X156]
MRSRLRGPLGPVLAALLTSTLGQLPMAPPAGAQGATGPAALVVLDVSGSMAAPGQGGAALIEQARTAVSSTVAALPAGSQVGLRVYGSTVGSEESNKAAGCQDSRLLVPVGPVNPAAINAALGSVQPSGWTPIGLALQQGAKDLPSTGPRTIVLVSDGLDTCAPPDPCEVARQLSADGVPVTVEAIGFNLPAGDPATRLAASCSASPAPPAASTATPPTPASSPRP